MSLFPGTNYERPYKLLLHYSVIEATQEKSARLGGYQFLHGFVCQKLVFLHNNPYTSPF